MTAEIALLNKVGVALAADSAATISAEDRDEKVFNSEDKLFQLSNGQPIGIMIYNAPYFLETPIQILIKKYRSLNRIFDTIDQAAHDFKVYLNDFGKSLDESVRKRSYQSLTNEPGKLVSERLTRELNRLQQASEEINFDKIFDESLEFYRDIFRNSGKPSYLNRSAQKMIIEAVEANRKLLEKENDGEQKRSNAKFNEMMEAFFNGAYPSRKMMGIVIAGYGEKELFPSLRSFQVDGMIAGSIRLLDDQRVDILYGGPNAKIVPYAQQEMVERFVSGVDKKSQRFIEKTCKKMLEDYRIELMSIFELENDEDRTSLETRLKRAESVFMLRLKDEGFTDLKDTATRDIESMIEFMPKPDLAQTAEALVELTSIKRRVSKGFDTVGGPIDVAVISKSEGFVWIKRKHYFDKDRNARYFARINAVAQRGVDDGASGSTARSRSGKGTRTRRGAGEQGSKANGEDPQKDGFSTGSERQPAQREDDQNA